MQIYPHAYSSSIPMTNNQKMSIIFKNLNKYHLSLYLDDIKTWDDPEEIHKRLLFEVQMAISYFYNDSFLDANSDIDYENIKVNEGYKLDFKHNTLDIHLQYKDSNSQKFTFKVWKVTRQEVIKVLNEKVKKGNYKHYYFQSDWNSPTFIQDLGKQYHEKVLKFIGKNVKVKNEEVLINKYRIYFEWFNGDNFKIKKSVKFNYIYLLSQDPIVLNIKLKQKIQINKIVKDFVPLLQKYQHLIPLQKTIPESLKWQDMASFFDKLQPYLDTLTATIKSAATLLSKVIDIDLDLENLQLSIGQLSPLGPFENELNLGLKINNSGEMIPFKLKFENTVNQESIKSLTNYLQTRFANFSILESFWPALNNNDNLLKMVKEAIGNKIIDKNQPIPFNGDLLTIQDYQKKGGKVQIQLKHQIISQPIEIEWSII